MILSKKTTTYLRTIAGFDGQCGTLTKGHSKQAKELVDNGLAIYIPLRQGGVQVALTAAGIQAYEATKKD